MSAPIGTSTAPGDAQEAAEALTVLDALARAPAAAALVVAALERAEDRKALRLAHAELRDAVGEATTKLTVYVRCPFAAAARPPTPLRWPRLEALTVSWSDLALGSATWGRLRALTLNHLNSARPVLDAPAARALAAALRRMPALRALSLDGEDRSVRNMVPSGVSTAELLRASGAEAAPRLRSLSARTVDLAEKGARALAATGWRLEELDLFDALLDRAGIVPLAAAPNFVIRRLNLRRCGLDAASLLNLANTPWPLEELDLSQNDLSGAAAGPALAALARHRGLRCLTV